MRAQNVNDFFRYNMPLTFLGESFSMQKNTFHPKGFLKIGQFLLERSVLRNYWIFVLIFELTSPAESHFLTLLLVVHAHAKQKESGVFDTILLLLHLQ